MKKLLELANPFQKRETRENWN